MDTRNDDKPIEALERQPEAPEEPKNVFFDGLCSQVVGEYPIEVPQFLYHYTSSEGVIGITSHHTLRFSDARFLNDGSEIRIGIHQAKAAIDAAIARYDDLTEDVGEKLMSSLIQVYGFFNPIVFCMSSENNLLNQWRDYGKDVVPYSVEMQTVDLMQYENFIFPTMLCKVEYDVLTQSQMMNSLFDKLYGEGKRIIQNANVNEDEIYMRAAMEIAWLSVRFKNPAFEAEKEWRLITYGPDVDRAGVRKEFRSSSLGAVPFYDWKRKDGGKLPITEVTVGPSPYAEVSDLALKELLKDKGYEIGTRYSTIPIRR